MRQIFPYLIPASAGKLQIDLAVEALKEICRSLPSQTTAYSKGENYAEKYDSVDAGDGFGVNRRCNTSSCGNCARADSTTATAKLQLDLPSLECMS
jgi:hypothetical protein